MNSKTDTTSPCLRINRGYNFIELSIDRQSKGNEEILENNGFVWNKTRSVYTANFKPKQYAKAILLCEREKISDTATLLGYKEGDYVRVFLTLDRVRQRRKEIEFQTTDSFGNVVLSEKDRVREKYGRDSIQYNRLEAQLFRIKQADRKFKGLWVYYPKSDIVKKALIPMLESMSMYKKYMDAEAQKNIGNIATHVEANFAIF